MQPLKTDTDPAQMFPTCRALSQSNKQKARRPKPQNSLSDKSYTPLVHPWTNTQSDMKRGLKLFTITNQANKKRSSKAILQAAGQFHEISSAKAINSLHNPHNNDSTSSFFQPTAHRIVASVVTGVAALPQPVLRQGVYGCQAHRLSD